MGEVFAFFDEDRDGRLDVEQFIGAVRSLGHAPTESDVAMFSRTVEKRYDGFLSLQEFVNVMTGVVIPRLCKAKDAATEINHAFKVFLDDMRGGDEGFVSASDLELLAKTQGDALDATSFEWLLRVAKPQDGHVDYAALTASILKGCARSD
ncbi:hypothetical protein FNF28_01278 [Cafeteria roenbergensis]|nr:hypothetical protein FNF28_01278 [Cafeteria roenbergensis]